MCRTIWEVRNCRKKVLSKAFDDRTYSRLTNPVVAPIARRAHLNLITAAGLFLQATPSKDSQLNNEPALFIAMLRRWLRIPFASQDAH